MGVVILEGVPVVVPPIIPSSWSFFLASSASTLSILYNFRVRRSCCSTSRASISSSTTTSCSSRPIIRIRFVLSSASRYTASFSVWPGVAVCRVRVLVLAARSRASRALLAAAVSPARGADTVGAGSAILTDTVSNCPASA